MALTISNLSYTYNKGTSQQVQALKGINLSIETGECTGFVGPVGCGKSTLLQLIAGLLIPDKGRIDNESLSIRLVFQYAEECLFADTVYEEIASGLKSKRLNKKETETSIRKALDTVGLDYSVYAQRSPFMLSSGQMRRVAIASVLALDPDVLILDEPTAGLDGESAIGIAKEIERLHIQTHKTILLVSQNISAIIPLAKRLVVMNKGEIFTDIAQDEYIQKIPQLEGIGLEVPPVLKLVNEINKNSSHISPKVKKQLREVLCDTPYSFLKV